MPSSQLIAIAGLGWSEILLIVGIFVLFFGAWKIPQLARGLGQGISEFRKGVKDGAKEE
ncbi:MAG: twin-arginine translocase TatA/TatE family subunit [Planctomycetota bacterium]